MRLPTAGLRLPATLTGRLVLTVVVLIALVGLLVSVSTTLLMREYLIRQVDEQVRSAAFGPGHRDDAFGLPPSLGPPPADRSGEKHGRDDDWIAFDADAGSPPYITVRHSGPDGAEYVALTDAQAQRLRDVPLDGGVTPVDLGDVGSYRVIAELTGDGVIVTGREVDGINQTLTIMLWLQLLLTAAAVAVAALAGNLLVRRALGPLREVASTAHEVTTLPLDTGEVGQTARVPDRLTDPDTEVGQVGAALNRLLGHVEGALDARHRSEQQVRQFVADASHELRTPLATIMGYAELARRSPSYSPVDALGKVEEEGVRMRGLVEDLLLLARLDAGRPLAQDHVDLTKLALEAVEDARVVASDHQWMLELPEEPVTVTGDDQRLHQVLGNLLTNARRHTPPGTTVRVGLRTEPGRAVLVVADDGPGIPAEVLPEVFERFTRADTSRTRDSGGAGLGLALVQAIVSAHGGAVRVDSVPGRTELTVSLPLG